MIQGSILLNNYASEANEISCSLHENNNYVAYCMKDKKLLCSQCMLQDNHSKHEILGFQKAAQIEKNILKNKAKTLTNI